MIGHLVAAVALLLPPAAPDPAGLDSHLRAALDATGLPGVSAVVTHGDRVVWATGAGHGADGRAVTADTPMRVASVSKAFTAAAVLTLVDEGRVALDAPVVTYLPDFRMADDRAARITVRQLLHQTSGLSDTTVDIGAAERSRSLPGYVSALRPGRLAAEPGSHWEYCNVNYDLAAAVVSAVTGQGFAEAMRERIFAPLGMTSSAVGAPGVPEGFVSVFGVWWPRPELAGFEDGGAGDVVTTAADMGRWLISQTGNGPRVLTPESLELMRAPQPGRDYGMGWGRERIGDRTILIHSGNLFTYTAIAGIDPATGHGFAVMINSASLDDNTYDILLGLVDVAGGGTPAVPAGGRQTIELILGLVALTALGLGTAGVLRSRRWAARRTGALRWATALHLLPAVILATCPLWLSVLMNGRTVTWAQMTYFPVPLTLTLLAAALAGLAVVTARLIRLMRPARLSGSPDRGE